MVRLDWPSFYTLWFFHHPVYTQKHSRPTDVSPLAEFYAARSTLSDHCYPQCHMIHICIHTYIIYHRSYNRLSERFQWFTMNGLLFILFGFFISWLHGQLLWVIIVGSSFLESAATLLCRMWWVLSLHFKVHYRV